MPTPMNLWPAFSNLLAAPNPVAATPFSAALANYGQPNTDPNDYSDRYNTKLSPKQEAAFLDWAVKNNKLNDSYDYDLRGFWNAGGKFSENGHGADQFKKPNHPTFSDQSMYHSDETPGGSWNKYPDGSYAFTPSEQMMQRPGYVEYMRNEYWPKAESGNVLRMGR